MAKKYRKSYSNYILRSNPSATKNGYVYENDLPTTSQKYNSVYGSMSRTTDGGFTFISNTTPDESKTYNNDGWEQKSYTLGDLDITNNDFKSANNSNEKLTINEQKYIKFNKSYTDLSDYCYFGSSNAMLKSSIDDIIINFPAALYLTNTSGLVITDNTITMSIIPDNPLGYVENKFFIDLLNYNDEERINLPYDLRVMGSSFYDYEVVNQDETFVGLVIGFTGKTDENPNTISLALDNIQALTGQTLLIRPSISKQNEFFDNLDDFQRALLDRYSIPKYRSAFKIPKETQTGVKYEYKYFTWSTEDGYNIDINSSNYGMFISDLIDATNFIDEMYCDNLYRMLTHDSIKNLDTSYYREIDEEKLDDIIVGGTKIQKLLRLYGRSFDELKKYIDEISFANSITYDGLNNLPVEYLDGKLNTCGWDVFSLLNTINKSGTTISGLFPSTTKSYTVEEVNTQLIRNLIINSNYIFKSKGTKKSIRKLFNLLGINEDWYEIREYSQIIDSFITGSTLEYISKLNYLIYPDGYTVNDGKEEYSYSSDDVLFDNTNIGTFIRCPFCGSENYITNGESTNLIPDVKNITIESKDIENNYLNTWYNLETGTTYTIQCEAISLIGDVTGYTISIYNEESEIELTSKIFETNKLDNFTFTTPNNSSGYKIIIYAGIKGATNNKSIRLNKLKLEIGPIPTSIYSDFDMGTCINNNEHKFSLTYSMVGYPKQWKSSDYYFQQMGNWYRETGGLHTNLTGLTYVNEISYGNNPHIGDGKYDNGYDYIAQFGDIFKRYLRNYGDENGFPIDEYINKGFNLSNKKSIDNKKISYNGKSQQIGNIRENGRLKLNLKNFVIGLNGDKILQSFFYNNNNEAIDIIKNTEGIPILFDVTTDSSNLINIINLSGTTTANLDLDYMTDNRQIKIHNSILGNGKDISVIGNATGTIGYGKTILVQNINGVGITITQYNGDDEFNILKSIALPYLEQLIPSTTIFDFCLVNSKPKWLLIDEYCERDSDGNFTGNKILAYQNINYFDSITNYPDDSLTGSTGIIVTDFGTGYTYNGNENKKNAIINEDGSITIEELNDAGFDNIYLFKKPSTDCGLNTDAIWVVDEDILIPTTTTTSTTTTGETTTTTSSTTTTGETTTTTSSTTTTTSSTTTTTSSTTTTTTTTAAPTYRMFMGQDNPTVTTNGADAISAYITTRAYYTNTIGVDLQPSEKLYNNSELTIAVTGFPNYYIALLKDGGVYPADLNWVQLDGNGVIIHRSNYY